MDILNHKAQQTPDIVKSKINRIGGNYDIKLCELESFSLKNTNKIEFATFTQRHRVFSVFFSEEVCKNDFPSILNSFYSTALSFVTVKCLDLQMFRLDKNTSVLMLMLTHMLNAFFGTEILL